MFTPAHAADDVKDNARQAAASSNQFGFDLYAQLAGEEKANLFFSPYSIEAALAMTDAGARGPTAQQMAQVLHLDLPPDQLHDAFAALTAALNASGKLGNERAFELVVANALWAQKGHDFKPEFLNLLKSKYAAGIEAMDFAGSDEARERSRKEINAWVEKQTHDKIKDLLAPGVITDLTRLVLTNAIYFKSKWDTQFSKGATKVAAFHTDANSSLDVPLMHQTSRRRYMDNNAIQAVEISYLAGRLSMIVLLPRKVDGLTELEKSLNSKNLDGWLNALGMREVELTLPKFQFSSQFGLGRTLNTMGMKDAFGPQADFTGISSGREFFIGDVIHKAFVAVNEQGTEAAAATAV